MAEDTSWDNIGTGDGGPYSEWDSGDNSFVNDLFSTDYNSYLGNNSDFISSSGMNSPASFAGFSNEGGGLGNMYSLSPEGASMSGIMPGSTGIMGESEEDRRAREYNSGRYTPMSKLTAGQGSIWDRILNSATSPEGLGKLGAGLASLFTKNKLAGQLRSNTDYLANRADPIGAALRGQAQGQASAILNDGGASNPMVQAAMRQAQEALLRTNSRNRYAASPMIADQLAAKQFELGQTQLNNLTRLLSNNADYRAVGSGLDKAAEAEANKYNGLATAIGDITRGSSGSDAKTIADTIIASLKGVK